MKSQYSSTVAKGLVIDQTPDQGTNASRGTQIDIVVSKGEEPAAPVTVPDLKGMTPSEAEAALTKVGLKGEKIKEYVEWLRNRIQKLKPFDHRDPEPRSQQLGQGRGHRHLPAFQRYRAGRGPKRRR